MGATLNDDRTEACAALLRQAAIELQVVITGDGRISEADAATLLAVSPGGLKAMRQEGRGPVAYRCAVNGSRLSYKLLDLALWIESIREGW